MTIHWNRIIVSVLLVIAIVIGLTSWRSIVSAVATLWTIGSRHHPDQQVHGIIVLGLLGIILVGIVRIFASAQKTNHRS